MPERILSDEVLKEGERLATEGKLRPLSDMDFLNFADGTFIWDHEARVSVIWAFNNGPALIAEVRRLRTENERLNRVADAFQETLNRKLMQEDEEVP